MQPVVLIAVLNWGLGHATRLIPIIDSFLLQEYKVHIASDGEALKFLMKEYPDLEFHSLPNYGIYYKYNSIFLNVFLATFPIFRAIKKENKIANDLVYLIKPNLLISDNRYGFWSNSVKSIFITHQLNIKLRCKLLSKLGTLFIKYLMRKFDQVWIPDLYGNKSLAGSLASVESGNKFKYIGPLSRFSALEINKEYDIAIVLSGPEPQRTIFEELIFKQLDSVDKRIIVVRGKLDGENQIKSFKTKDNIIVKDYLLSNDLNIVLNKCEFVISRSGYSTIMDLAILGKKAVLVATPGQTEQEYLAKYLKDKGYFFSMPQNKFDIQMAIDKYDNYKGVRVETTFDLEKILTSRV